MLIDARTIGNFSDALTIKKWIDDCAGLIYSQYFIEPNFYSPAARPA